MIKLTFDITQFLSISLDECLNYVSYPKLETIVKSAVDSTLMKIEKYDIKSKEHKSEYFLQHILLRLSSHEVWLGLSNENRLDQLYLYKIIRKYLYLKEPNFLN